MRHLKVSEPPIRKIRTQFVKNHPQPPVPQPATQTPAPRRITLPASPRFDLWGNHCRMLPRHPVHSFLSPRLPSAEGLAGDACSPTSISPWIDPCSFRMRPASSEYPLSNQAACRDTRCIPGWQSSDEAGRSLRESCVKAAIPPAMAHRGRTVPPPNRCLPRPSAVLPNPAPLAKPRLGFVPIPFNWPWTGRPWPGHFPAPSRLHSALTPGRNPTRASV